MKVSTSSYSYSGPHRYDITRKSGEVAFAPTWEMITQYKHDLLTEKEYKTLYYQQLKGNLRRFPLVWDTLLQRDEVVLICYCPADTFCHRHLLKEVIRRLCERKGIPFEDGGEIA